jgi:transposase
MKKMPSSCPPVFKTYNQDQMNLLPPTLDELIPENHLVRLVNGSIDKMNIEPLLETYKGGGTSSYYPKMLLKVIVYGYINQIYSCRNISKALRENIHFMWLSAGNRPDFRTINEFRSKRLKRVVDEVFTSLLMELLDLGYVKLEHYFVDGSKFQANANKYSYVWAKNTRRYKENVQKKIKALLFHIDRIQEEENREYGDHDLEETGEDHQITSEELEGIAKKIDENLNKQEQDESRKKSLKRVKQKIEKDYLPRLKRYENQERDLSGRNSCSKTDKDATFFRYNNNELLPSYNVMLGTENQFILNYSVHQKPTDSVLFIPHMAKLKSNLGFLPSRLVGDAGFGSEENYAYLEKNKIKNYLKYNTFYQEEKGKHKKNPYHRSNFKYSQSDDAYECPEGEKLYQLMTRKVKSQNG